MEQFNNAYERQAATTSLQREWRSSDSCSEYTLPSWNSSTGLMDVLSPFHLVSSLSLENELLEDASIDAVSEISDVDSSTESVQEAAAHLQRALHENAEDEIQRGKNPKHMSGADQPSEMKEVNSEPCKVPKKTKDERCESKQPLEVGMVQRNNMGKQAEEEKRLRRVDMQRNGDATQKDSEDETQELRVLVCRMKAELSCVERQKQTACEELHQAVAKHQQDMQDLGEKNRELWRKVEEKEKAILDLSCSHQAQVTRMTEEEEQRKETQEQQVQDVQVQLQECSLQMLAAREELAQKERVMEEAQQRSIQTQEQIAALQKQIQDISEQHERVMEENSVLQHRLEHEEGVSARLHEENLSLEKHLEEARQQCESFERSLEAQALRLEELAQMQNKEHLQMEAERRNMRAVYQNQHELQLKLQEEMLRSTQYKMENDRLKEEMSDLQQEVEEMKEMLQKEQRKVKEENNGAILLPAQFSDHVVPETMTLQMKAINDFLLQIIDCNSKTLKTMVQLVEECTQNISGLPNADQLPLECSSFASDWSKMSAALAAIVQNDCCRKEEALLCSVPTERDVSGAASMEGQPPRRCSGPSLEWKLDVPLEKLKEMLRKWSQPHRDGTCTQIPSAAPAPVRSAVQITASLSLFQHTFPHSIHNHDRTFPSFEEPARTSVGSWSSLATLVAEKSATQSEDMHRMEISLSN